jgi:hypothetical protein
MTRRKGKKKGNRPIVRNSFDVGSAEASTETLIMPIASPGAQPLPLERFIKGDCGQDGVKKAPLRHFVGTLALRAQSLVFGKRHLLEIFVAQPLIRGGKHSFL